MDNSYRICWTLEAWASVLREAQDSHVNGIDLETGPNPDLLETSALRAEESSVIAGIAIAWKDPDGNTKSAYCPIRHWVLSAGGVQPKARAVLAMLSDHIEARRQEDVIVVGNLAMELSFFAREQVVWPRIGQLQDVQVVARVLNKGVGPEELIGMKALAPEYLGRKLDTKSEMDEWLVAHRFKKGRDIWRAPVALAGPYAQDDARDNVELWELWKQHVSQPVSEWWWHRDPNRMDRKDLYELEMNAAIKALMCGLRGTRINIELCRHRTTGAEVLQSVAKRWIQARLDMPNLNPASSTQLRGILFAEAFGLKVSLAHMTDSFKKLPDREQTKVIDGTGDKPISDYASMDADAMKHYEQELPSQKDLFFMIAVFKKCQTAIMWFRDNVSTFGQISNDPWWPSAYDDDAGLVWLIFHRLRTVATVSGRMACSDYNAQQTPKRLKMLMDADRLIGILIEFLPIQQLNELLNLLDFADAAEGDEAKYVGIEPGARVVDFSARSMFIPRAGRNWRTHDLSQVEMKGFAHYTGNRLLCDGYGNPLSEITIERELDAMRQIRQGADPHKALVGLDVRRHERMERENKFDIHKFVGDEIGISRKAAKGINFGIVYGMGKKKLCRSLGLTASQGEMYLGQYNARLPEIAMIQTMIKQKLRERGYVFDPFGRRYYLPVSRAYVGLNRLIQGWAASVFKVGFVRTVDLFSSPYYGGVDDRVMRLPRMGGALVLTCIHDEIDSEIPYELDDGLLDFCVRSCMTLIGGLKVPLSTSSESSNVSWDGAAPREFTYEGVE